MFLLLLSFFISTSFSTDFLHAGGKCSSALLPIQRMEQLSWESCVKDICGEIQSSELSQVVIPTKETNEVFSSQIYPLISELIREAGQLDYILQNIDSDTSLSSELFIKTFLSKYVDYGVGLFEYNYESFNSDLNVYFENFPDDKKKVLFEILSAEVCEEKLKLYRSTYNDNLTAEQRNEIYTKYRRLKDGNKEEFKFMLKGIFSEVKFKGNGTLGDLESLEDDDLARLDIFINFYQRKIVPIEISKEELSSETLWNYSSAIESYDAISTNFKSTYEISFHENEKERVGNEYKRKAKQYFLKLKGYLSEETLEILSAKYFSEVSVKFPLSKEEKIKQLKQMIRAMTSEVKVEKSSLVKDSEMRKIKSFLHNKLGAIYSVKKSKELMINSYMIVSPDVYDHYDPRNKIINVSIPTLSNLNGNYATFAHEFSHSLNFLLKEIRNKESSLISKQSKNLYSFYRSCTNRKRGYVYSSEEILEEGNLFNLFGQDYLKTEEDTADLIASLLVRELKVKNDYCFNYPERAKLYDSENLETHSSYLYRLLFTQINSSGNLPASCQFNLTKAGVDKKFLHPCLPYIR